MIKIYTDGSCLENPGNGGWAAIIIDDGKKTIIKGSKKKYYKQPNGTTCSYSSFKKNYQK